MPSKREILGQYFTKLEVVDGLLDLLSDYKNYGTGVKILEPSFGTGNFIKGLNKKGFHSIDGCEIDGEFTKEPSDFFELPLEKKFDLIVGNPPFSKYNLRESYYFADRYSNSSCDPVKYLTKNEIKKDKEKIENVFILKSLKHLKNNNSSIGFVLPVSFFIKNRNKSVKNELLKYFSTVIIYQDEKIWFDYNIPCCFAIFANIDKFKNKILTIFNNNKKEVSIFDVGDIHEELIPQVVFHKNNGIGNETGVPLKELLDPKTPLYKKSYIENNVSAKNILSRTKIPSNEGVEDYKLAVVRVGNASVGRCGLINVQNDILNDMFYVFDFEDELKEGKRTKELVCQQINGRRDYFGKITCRVGSKSIKKEDILGLKVRI